MPDLELCLLSLKQTLLTLFNFIVHNIYIYDFAEYNRKNVHLYCRKQDT